MSDGKCVPHINNSTHKRCHKIEKKRFWWTYTFFPVRLSKKFSHREIFQKKIVSGEWKQEWNAFNNDKTETNKKNFSFILEGVFLQGMRVMKDSKKWKTKKTGQAKTEWRTCDS